MKEPEMNKQEKERKIEKGRDRGRGKRKEDKRKEIEPMQGAEKDVKAKLFLACAQESARERCVPSCFSHIPLFVTLWTVLLCPWDSPGKNIGMGCLALL